ncbi:SIR2 family protein [Streptomyces avermitilis]|uniref:SIR2 family protein n=1 Tax=Streptomyces avermitilis TaxID=33903 RepID=UPI00369F9FFA
MAMALNVHSSPGVYALLLGAGISIASGVKTGWGVVQDIVGKVAAVRDPENPGARAEAAADPEKWWEANTSEPLGYSALLAAAAPMPASRQAMLAEYFEPEEGQEDSKGPTAAHRAIAQLVKRGSVRVVLTTNFDRLTERALQEVGISPQVVSRPEQIKGMKPLAHSQVTVIKLHGDYADLEQRNTVDELETYPKELQQLLERVLDEYGLIVCAGPRTGTGGSSAPSRGPGRAGTRCSGRSTAGSTTPPGPSPRSTTRWYRRQERRRAVYRPREPRRSPGPADHRAHHPGRRRRTAQASPARPSTPNRVVRPRRPSRHPDRRPQHARAQASVCHIRHLGRHLRVQRPRLPG